MTMTAYELTRAIIKGNYTNEELTEIISAVKYARAQLGRTVTVQLRQGDTVSFVGRGNRTVTGTVSDIKIKNVIVSTSTGKWRVPANMLTKI